MKLILIFYFYISPSTAVVCKCTGYHCVTDKCKGDFCIAAFVRADSKAKTRGEPTHLYVRGCATFDFPYLETVNFTQRCFDYDDSNFEHERRKICVCRSRMCNDGPLISLSLNPFRQRICENKCVGEFCLSHGLGIDQSISTSCVNRSLPLLDHFLQGLIISPALAPTLIQFPDHSDKTVSLLCSNASCTFPFVDQRDFIDCPTLFTRIEHRDDPEICVPPKRGFCKGRFCLDVHFNVTSFRGHVLERRYKGCVMQIQDETKLELLQSFGNCVHFESPAVNVTACINFSAKLTLKNHIWSFISALMIFMTFWWN